MDRDLTESETDGAEAVPSPWPAVLSMGLAGLGVAVSALGAHLANPWWELRGGPALTVAGAVLWLYLRRRRRSLQTGDRRPTR